MRAIICLMVIVLSLASCSEEAKWPHEKFNQDRWRQSVVTERFRFANDLTENHLLIGKSRGEVLESLGTPDSEDDRQLTYLLAVRDGGFNQVWMLDVFFGEDGIVKSTAIRGD